MTLIKEMEQRGHSRELTFLRRMNEEVKQYRKRRRRANKSNRVNLMQVARQRGKKRDRAPTE